MKKILSIALTAAIASSWLTPPRTVSADADSQKTETISYNYSYDYATGYNKNDSNTRQMEKLDRGLIAIQTDDGVYLSWRLFDSEDTVYGSALSNVDFVIYRDNSKIATVSDTTNYIDTTKGASYSVAPVIDGVEGEKCEPVSVMNNIYFDIPLTKPEPETVYDNDGNVVYKDIAFSPADCSTGDLDGDGEYEIIIKWTSSEHDVGSPGSPSYSGTIRFAAYKLDGTKLWANEINLGKNVYSSAHTAQFLVYDFDGDGKSEMIVQTSLGSTDANGNYVSHSAKADSVVASTNKKIAEYTDEENETADFNGYDRKITGEEFLTVFNGETGEAVDTIDLPTSRGSANGIDYGDDFGNRSNRFIASVAYLDGEKPYAVYLRGYYFGRNGRQRTSIAGISFDGERLSPDYRFDTKSGQPGYYDGAYQYVGQGNHNCTVADVDNDGKDEFITGALCMEVKDDNTFKPRWCTYLQHGDALHIGDYDPTHQGLEFFTVHEDEGTNTLGPTPVTMDFGMSVIDADTGEIIFHMPNTKDTGRGVMANTGSGGYYQITGVGSYQCNGGTNFTSTRNGAGSNFRIFWDGDLYDELLDGTNVTNYNGDGFNAGDYDCTQVNGTKANPALQADLFGDWREELVYPTTDGTKLRVFSTITPTDYKIKTLMHDPVYRSGVAAEQTAYNQPPHVGFYLAEEVFESTPERIEIKSMPVKTSYVLGENLDTTGLELTAYLSDGTSKTVTKYAVSGYDSSKAGTQTITVFYQNVSTTFEVYVKTIESIDIISPPSKTIYKIGEELDLSGLTVSVVFDNGETEIVSDYKVSNFDKYASGEQTIIIDYKGFTDEFKTNSPSGFTVDDDGYVTSYSGNDETVICPTSVDGIKLTGFRRDSMTSSGIKKIYFYQEPVDFEKGLIFPADTTIGCYKNSTSHEYADSLGMNVEFINLTKVYADITADENEYGSYNDGDSIVYQHEKQAWTVEMPYATYGVGARSNNDGGDRYTGIYKRVDSDGNAYLEAKAGQFSTVNRHAYISFTDVPVLSASGQCNLSFDFSIPSNSNNMSIVIAKSQDFAVLNNSYDISTNENTIYAIQAGKDNVLANTSYHYSLVFADGQYSQTVTNTETGDVIQLELNNPFAPGAICFPCTGTSRNQAVSAYIDNITLTSDSSSNICLTVTDNIGTLVEGANVTLNGTYSAVTDESGKANFNGVPSGAYSAVVSFEGAEFTANRFVADSADVEHTITLDKKIQILSKVTLNVTDANNLPVPNAYVYLETDDSSIDTSDLNAYTDQNGTVIFENVPNANYTVSAEYGDWDKLTQNLPVVSKVISADIKFNDAFTYRALSADSKNIHFELAGTDDVRVFAVKYNENHALQKIIEIKKLSAGENTLKIASVGFTPDNLFIWNNNMLPLSSKTTFETE